MHWKEEGILDVQERDGKLKPGQEDFLRINWRWWILLLTELAIPVWTASFVEPFDVSLNIAVDIFTVNVPLQPTTRLRPEAADLMCKTLAAEMWGQDY
jgi:hypothetical protein